MPTASTASVAAVMLTASSQLFGNSAPRMKPVTDDGSFLSSGWETKEDGSPPCTFYNGSHVFTGALCSHFAVARMSHSIQAEATTRALECAAHFELDCLLSPEVGLNVPSAFVYDQDHGLKMMIAPKLKAAGDNASTKLISFRSVDGATSHAQLEMLDSVEVEYLLGGQRRMTTEVLNGSAAYCVQMLRLAFLDSCWAEID